MRNFASRIIKILHAMTTTISLPTAQYNRAKAYASERNMSIDELFVMLIDQMADDNAEDALADSGLFNPYEHTQEELFMRIQEAEKQYEQGEWISDEALKTEVASMIKRRIA